MSTLRLAHTCTASRRTCTHACVHVRVKHREHSRTSRGNTPLPVHFPGSPLLQIASRPEESLDRKSRLRRRKREPFREVRHIFQRERERCACVEHGRNACAHRTKCLSVASFPAAHAPAEPGAKKVGGVCTAHKQATPRYASGITQLVACHLSGCDHQSLGPPVSKTYNSSTWSIYMTKHQWKLLLLQSRKVHESMTTIRDVSIKSCRKTSFSLHRKKIFFTFMM